MKIALIGAMLLSPAGSLVLAGSAAAEVVPPAATAAPSAPPSAASPSAGPTSASPVPEEPDAKATGRAKEWLSRLQKGSLDRSQLTSDLNAGLQDTTVQALAKQLGPLGLPQKMALRDKTSAAGNTTWVFHVVWGDKAFDYSFGIDTASGRISALLLKPSLAT